jgi:hypothetical protein
MNTKRVIVTHTDRYEKGLISLNVNAEVGKKLIPGKEYDLTETEIEVLEEARTIVGKPRRNAAGGALVVGDASMTGPDAQEWEPEPRFNIKEVGNVDKRTKLDNERLANENRELKAQLAKSGKVENEVRNVRGNNRKGSV